MNQFIITADTGSGNEYQKKVAESMVQLHKRFEKVQSVFLLGDNIYPDGVKGVKDKKFKLQFEEMYKRLPKSLEFFNVLGNHDYMGNCNAQIEYTQKSKRWTRHPGTCPP